MGTDRLTALRHDVLLDLRTAPRKRKSPWRTPVIATIDESGQPTTRVVVLREATNEFLEFHTDVRSRKWSDLSTRTAMSCNFWDKGKQVQLRVTGSGRLHHGDAIAQDRWSRLSESQRRTYGVIPGPGTSINGALDYKYTALGEDQFAVIRCTIERMDWLYLARTGHQRARFERCNEGWRSTYLAP